MESITENVKRAHTAIVNAKVPARSASQAGLLEVEVPTIARVLLLGTMCHPIKRALNRGARRAHMEIAHVSAPAILVLRVDFRIILTGNCAFVQLLDIYRAPIKQIRYPVQQDILSKTLAPPTAHSVLLAHTAQ